MKKTINTNGLLNELQGSVFFPKKTEEPKVQDPIPTPPLQPGPTRQVYNKPQPERSNDGTPERANGRRIITRNSFEIYEDQMDALRELAYTEKKQGKLGSMSAMVRDAIDTYILNKSPEK